jgi:hypothetical protein
LLMMHVASPLATENYAVACEAGALTKAGVLRVSRICSHNVPAGNRPVMHYVYLLQSQSHVAGALTKAGARRSSVRSEGGLVTC